MSKTKKWRVLVIEDDPDTQANLQDILQLDGYDVDLASTVEEALRERDWPSLFAVVLDRRLPDGTADTLLPRLRQLAPKAAVIVVTGYADLEGAIAVIRHGIADFIPKPVNADMLRASLARAVHQNEMRERTERSERLAALGQMLASVAHESRNALQRIQISVEILEDKLKEDPAGLKDLAVIDKAAGNLHWLLEELRNYVAPIQLERNECKLSSVWRSAWQALAHERRDRSIEFEEVSCDPELSCYVDRERLEQVFRNLFENSLSACGQRGRIHISCSSEKQHESPYVEVLVRDTGPGLNEQQLANVFKPFFTTKSKGTGLGMSIARQIVEAHGGRIDVAKELRPGAAFRIHLPQGSNGARQS